MLALITAFDAFGGEAVNPALMVLEDLKDELGRLRLLKAQLPTAFDQAAGMACALIRQHRPAFALFLGQAGGRQGITVERLGINLMDAQIPDNLGRQPREEAIDPAGPAAYFSTLPVSAMVEALRAAGLPASASLSAGSFVCNHLLYSALHFIEQQGLSVPAAFIHLPFVPEQAAGKQPQPPSMALAEQVKGIEAVLAWLANTLS